MMLRITTHDDPEAMTFQLEGRLAGPWRYTMKTSPTVLLAAALLVTGLIGGLWSLLSAEPGGYAVPAVAAAAMTGVAGFTWQQSRARARRWKAALDAYADREMARAGAQ